ncbi:stressosome-associated protein Prli42 [Priestia flexa]|uniref:Stressosome-associated protein Prli42 n=1 Tax=Priestia flexa TaxID=86664 RepID=A0A1N6N796_9BACI|nr:MULTISPECIES: stressosome-associated protein Prli42 [Bacillaceae]USY54397.1 stressosome-associated protein Prli42 [Bacillus sp. 1780r2a1]MBN8250326.1 stressosome-associated protein Prli42 [Priestia flexa]MBN8432852.1 stressosome-associated protein Prli42 [Priestia flexa]MBY6085039.1 stressosome-associated protein Prli42 [Priestia flexa]MCA0965162.1 stressosome-associated protein Prli42 [Priestia flexa]
MSNKKWQKIVVYLMLGTMVITTVLAGITMWL